MEQTELKNLIKSILVDMVDENGEVNETTSGSNNSENKVVAKPQNTDIEDGILDDITEVNIREQYLVDNPYNGEAFKKMKLSTPARLGLGRAGTRYKTEPVLRFRADHAAAQDAVFSYVDEDFIKEAGFIPVETLCDDKDTYITRPDLGRKFDEENQKIIKDTIPQGADIAVVVGDGLSSAAVEANVKDLIPAIKQGLKTHGLDFGDILFVKHCRVGAQDHIGDLTGAKVICMLIGERPGLVTAESMSAYMAYKPTVGMPESRRTVISNIHSQGTPAVEAGAYIADVLKKIYDAQVSGTELKKVSGGE